MAVIAEEKSREEIEALKKNWLSDPIWDIEETEGFEAHKEELTLFHNEWRERWELANQERVEKEMKEMGIENFKTYQYMKSLETRLKYLERKLGLD